MKTCLISFEHSFQVNILTYSLLNKQEFMNSMGSRYRILTLSKNLRIVHSQYKNFQEQHGTHLLVFQDIASSLNTLQGRISLNPITRIIKSKAMK